jgi:hypothetical protein
VNYYDLSINNVKEYKTTSEKRRRKVSVYTPFCFNRVNTRDAGDAEYRLHNQKRVASSREEPTPHLCLRPRNSRSPAPRSRLLKKPKSIGLSPRPPQARHEAAAGKHALSRRVCRGRGRRRRRCTTPTPSTSATGPPIWTTALILNRQPRRLDTPPTS